MNFDIWVCNTCSLMELSAINAILGIIGYFYQSKIIRYISYISSATLTIYFIHGIFKHKQSFDLIELLCILIAIILSNQIVFLLEKILKRNNLDSVETKYIKCGFEKTSALAILAAGYDAIDLLHKSAPTWQNLQLAALFASNQAFYLNLSILYATLSLAFILVGLEIACTFALIASGHCVISLFASANTFHVWITLFYGISALICILIGKRKKLFSLKLVGFYLALLTLWKLFFIINASSITNISR